MTMKSSDLLLYELQVHQRKYLAECAQTVKRASPNLQICIVTQMRAIGINCPQILAEHRKLFEELREQASLKDYSQAALDVIEGRRYLVISVKESFTLCHVRYRSKLSAFSSCHFTISERFVCCMQKYRT